MKILLLDKIVEKTDKFKQLQRNLSFAESEYSNLHLAHNELSKKNELLEKQIAKNKTEARRIVRLTNSLLKKDELVTTKKQIQAICQEIIKGE